ncbi:peptidyl-prolyl cis-trans isomerase [Aureococcus anophagefferens]|uniref:peptidylprolyl isomerase n=1 Tax=Aureococcus anophagefferens TaxID=44056 RepID=A0ABR1FIR0_AURAN
MAQAQGNPTARLQIVGVFPSDVSPCMRSRSSDVVEVDYVGSVAGVVFDSRRRFAAMLGSKELPAGLELGLFEMCIGERRLLRVPPALGFGTRGSKLYGVPPDATLDYDVTLRGINLQYDPRVRREDLDFEQRY